MFHSVSRNFGMLASSFAFKVNIVLQTFIGKSWKISINTMSSKAIPSQEEDTSMMGTHQVVKRPKFLPWKYSHLSAQERRSICNDSITHCRATTRTIKTNNNTSMGMQTNYTFIGTKLFTIIINTKSCSGRTTRTYLMKGNFTIYWFER